MKAANTLFASVLALGAGLGAPAMSFDIGALRPAGDAAETASAMAAPATDDAEAKAPALAGPADMPKADAVIVPAVLPVIELDEAAKDAPAAGATPPALPPALPVAEVTPPPLPQLPAFYVGVDGNPVGPLDEAALRDMIARGALTEASLVWTEGMPDWVKAAEVAEINDLLMDGSGKLGTKKDAAGARPVAAGDAEPVPAAVARTMPAARVLPGDWHIDGPMQVEGLGIGDADIAVVFNPDGTYQTSGTITAVVPGLAAYPVEIVVQTEGYWTVVTLADGTEEVQINATTYISIPEMGMPTQVNTGYEAFVVQVVDGDTLVVDGTEWARMGA